MYNDIIIYILNNSQSIWSELIKALLLLVAGGFISYLSAYFMSKENHKNELDRIRSNQEFELNKLRKQFTIEKEINLLDKLIEDITEFIFLAKRISDGTTIAYGTIKDGSVSKIQDEYLTTEGTNRVDLELLQKSLIFEMTKDKVLSYFHTNELLKSKLNELLVFFNKCRSLINQLLNQKKLFYTNGKADFEGFTNSITTTNNELILKIDKLNEIYDELKTIINSLKVETI